jgi:Thiol-disulfide isomerase and thioredoxins
MAIACSTSAFGQMFIKSKEADKQDSLFMLNLGKSYPAFTATTLEGKTVTEKEMIGKVTFINFWWQFCGPCIAEFNALNALYGKFRSNPKFQYLSFTYDSINDAKEMVRKHGLPYPVCSIPQKECYRLNFGQGFPTTIIVDQTGKVAFLKSGGAIDKEIASQLVLQFEKEIERLLEKE